MSTQDIHDTRAVHQLDTSQVQHEKVDEQHKVKLREGQDELPEISSEDTLENRKSQLKTDNKSEEIKEKNEESFEKAQDIGWKEAAWGALKITGKALKFCGLLLISPIKVPLCLVGAGCGLIGYSIIQLEKKYGLQPESKFAEEEKFFKEQGMVLLKMPQNTALSCFKGMSAHFADIRSYFTQNKRKSDEVHR